MIAVVYGQNNTYRIGIVDPANGDFQILTNGRLDESPSFAPNGAQIIYATRQNGRGVLASVSTDGRIKTQIASVPATCVSRSGDRSRGHELERAALQYSIVHHYHY